MTRNDLPGKSRSCGTSHWRLLDSGNEPGQILWEATLQRCIPGELLGRVASFDAFVSSGLTPVSLALVGPVAGALGALSTLRWAGVFAGGILVVFLDLLHGLRTEPKPVASWSA